MGVNIKEGSIRIPPHDRIILIIDKIRSDFISRFKTVQIRSLDQ